MVRACGLLVGSFFACLTARWKLVRAPVRPDSRSCWIAGPSFTAGAPAAFTCPTIVSVLCSAFWRNAISFRLTDFRSELPRISVLSCWLPDSRSPSQVCSAPQTVADQVSGFVPDALELLPPPPQPAAAKASMKTTERGARSRTRAILAVPKVERLRQSGDEVGRSGELPRERREGLDLAHDDVLVALHALEDAAGKDERLAPDDRPVPFVDRRRDDQVDLAELVL